MKRLILSIIALSLILCGCGGDKKPDDISREAYEKAAETIDAIDLYLDEKTDLDKTLDKLYEIDVDVSLDEEYMLSLERNENDELIDNTLEFPRDCAIYVDIFDIRTVISTLRVVDGEGEQKILDQAKGLRDGLSKKINYKD